MTARHTNDWRRAARRLLAGALLAAGVIAGTRRPASAATTATFSNGMLTVFGDGADNTIASAATPPARSWSTAAPSPSSAARRRSPTPR